MKKILFVCTGNTCRSPMAEGIFNAAVTKDASLKGLFKAYSRGLSAYEGELASKNAVCVLRKDWDIDISMHRAKLISAQDIMEADLVLAMTRSHKNSLVGLFPEFKEKIFTLKGFTLGLDANTSYDEYNYNLDIQDPYAASIEVYRKCAHEIKSAIDKVLDKLKEKS